ncbi:DUF456 domain-containing protein [Flavobacterium humi]|uniref:DUF456 domain-containing protein n=1 Tax=Flavobacterium humi TaxID=2562683 RepID=A0A4Z0L5X5_9FLAO|nr:DUF456 domain-containing protein [Flavobacterium humi]TGD57668.1 DUF456 domain-containing protein [Flavobacterium humi]
MDTLLLILGFVCVVAGIFGSFLPVLPGPSISWVGLLLLYLTDAVPNNYWVLGITLLVTVLITVLDYMIPAKGTRKFGGSSYGVWGTNIGLVVGLFVPIPFGFVIGAFLGAFVGEMIYDSQDQKRALKAATGSFLGFLASTFMKFLVCMLFLGTFIYVGWSYRALLF